MEFQARLWDLPPVAGRGTVTAAFVFELTHMFLAKLTCCYPIGLSAVASYARLIACITAAGSFRHPSQNTMNAATSIRRLPISMRATHH